MEIAQTNKDNNFFKFVFKYFTRYERLWMLGIVILAIVMAIIFPESDTTFTDDNGNVTFVSSGLVLTILYVLDSIIGCFCELLFSKQNKWAFLIYNIVEVIEIVILLLIGERFASMATALFYWIPAHTLGFVFWNKHKDKRDKRVTVVRKLKVWQTVVIMVSTIVGTFVIGYISARIDLGSDFYSSDVIKKVVAYLDASLAVMSIIDGILMFFRSRESWWTWYLYIAIETTINIISGQWILLVYKIGYLTNTTYGLIRWTKYIKENGNQAESVVNTQKQ